MALNLDDLIGSMQHGLTAGDRGAELNEIRENLRAALGAHALGPSHASAAAVSELADAHVITSATAAGGAMSWKEDAAMLSVPPPSSSHPGASSISSPSTLAMPSAAAPAAVSAIGIHPPAYARASAHDAGNRYNPGYSRWPAARSPPSSSTTTTTSLNPNSFSGGFSSSLASSTASSSANTSSTSYGSTSGYSSGNGSAFAAVPANTPQQTPVERSTLLARFDESQAQQADIQSRVAHTLVQQQQQAQQQQYQHQQQQQEDPPHRLHLPLDQENMQPHTHGEEDMGLGDEADRTAPYPSSGGRHSSTGIAPPPQKVPDPFGMCVDGGDVATPHEARPPNRSGGVDVAAAAPTTTTSSAPPGVEALASTASRFAVAPTATTDSATAAAAAAAALVAPPPSPPGVNQPRKLVSGFVPQSS